MLSAEFLQLFYTKLNLNNYRNNIQTTFLAVMTRYLKHNRNEEVKGRTLEYIERQLDKLISFAEVIECTEEEIITILINLPTILNIVDELYNKYLFLGILGNKQRKEKLVHRTKDYMVGLDKLYARYCLAQYTKYNDLNWNSLVHASNKEFASIFIKGNHHASYQLFSSVEEVNNWLSQIDRSNLDFNVIKELEVNKEIVARYEGKDEKNGWSM